MKKFISIVWFYPKYIQSLPVRSNYILHPFKVARDTGYECELFVIVPLPVKIPDYIHVVNYRGIVSYVLYILNNRGAVFYANSFIWQSLLVGILAKRSLFMPHGFSYPNSFLRRVAVSFFYRFFDSVRVTSRYEGSLLVEKLKIQKNKIWFCPLVVEDADLLNLPIRNNPNGKCLTVLMASVWRFMKDPITIFRAVGNLKRDGINIRLLIAGDDQLSSSKKGEKSLIWHIKKFGIENDTEFIGKYSHKDLNVILGRADIFCQSSINEGQCLVVYEAALAGLPLFLSRIPSFIGPFGRSAFFHDIGDAEMLSKNIKKFFENSDDVSESLQKNREYVKTECSYEKVSHRLKLEILRVASL